MRNIAFKILLLFFIVGCKETVHIKDKLKTVPSIYPDYVGVTIPVEIAPLNFKVKDTYEYIDAVFEGKKGEKIHIQQSGDVLIPVVEWKQLLQSNVEDSIKVTVSIKKMDAWYQYQPFSIFVSGDDIDGYLAYRLIAPGYEVYSKMGIYQRSLADFEQSSIIENTLVQGSCLNCHSFCQGDAQKMSLHVRGQFGGTVLLNNNETKVLKTKTPETISKFVYPYWHPSGNYIAYTNNDTHQVFHALQNKKIEVFDNASDIVVYNVNKNEVIQCPLLQRDSVFETFPSFSPEGDKLYFCSAPAQHMPMEYTDVRYNLCSIDFDAETGTFSDKVDTLFNAVAINKSVTFPRPSPDGKTIMFTLVDYGNFSIWHKEADLYLYDVASKQSRILSEVNSDDTESYHSWSGNGRWFVFSSRRLDGLYTRPYIAHFGKDGKIGKPFLLPQKDVDYYQNLLFSYNIPEFVKGEVKLDIPKLESQLKGEKLQVEVRN